MRLAGCQLRYLAQVSTACNAMQRKMTRLAGAILTFACQAFCECHGTEMDKAAFSNDVLHVSTLLALGHSVDDAAPPASDCCWLAATVCGDLGENSFGLVPKIRMISLADGDGDVKKAAKKSLEEIAKAAKSPLPKPTLPEVLQYLNKNQAELRLRALERLVEMGGAAKDSVASKMPNC